MNRMIYRLSFISAVHFGRKDITETENSFCADTLFSALCQEAVREDIHILEDFCVRVRSGDILFSDAFPYVGEELYIPKPFLSVKREQKESDSVKKKAMKKLKFLPAGKLDALLDDRLDVEKAVSDFKQLGNSEEKVCAWVRGTEETKPFRVGTYSFREGNGLYVILQYRQESDRELFEKLLSSLQYSGIGGERSSGYGRFSFRKEKLPKALEKRFSGEYEHYMALSVCMAKEEELDQVMEGASFILKKRSGFTDSAHAGERGFRKKDMYMFSCGACFRTRFAGDVFDVSRNQVHPVYRYGKAMMIGV